MPIQGTILDTPQKAKKLVPDAFAASTKPLAEVLDSVRNLEGFPIGTDEDILALSDPPYYTACPNPYLKEFIEHFGKPYDEANDTYERTPFVGDVSEGKTDPIYNAHSYHTKVPHKAIMHYIEHYTEPGDIVFDGFCGSGMTGVAAQLLGRKAILSDLSPAASFIAYNLNTPVDVDEFEREATRILNEVEKECGWLYETVHTDKKTKGRINYTVWSDVFLCPFCNNEYVFWDVAVNKDLGKVINEYSCPHCQALLNKGQSERATVTFHDAIIDQKVVQAKQVPVQINYTVGNQRFIKIPDDFDDALLKKIIDSAIPYWYPTSRIPDGCNTEQPRRSHGFTHAHHFFSKKNLWILGALWERIQKSQCMQTKILFQSAAATLCSKLVRYNMGNRGNGILTGTLYVPSLIAEGNAIKIEDGKKKDFVKAFSNLGVEKASIISCGSTTKIMVTDNSVDYIFTDPPFGGNLMYSELNFLWEAWLGVLTNNSDEAIMNEIQQKGLSEYKGLMTIAFQEMYRILKPNRWITVEFHNSKASVWNAIQDAMTKAGFIIAQVAVLDKQQGSFKQVTSAGAVKNDLVINAYKPRKKFEENFLKRAGEDLERDFVADLLNHLQPTPHINRTEQMLFSKMLAHYVQRGFEIRLNARQFYQLLKDHFKFIDGYWFTDAQVMKYEEWKRKQGLAGIKEIKSGQNIMFISDERSALVWLYYFLSEPQTYSDIYTEYHKVAATAEDTIPEVKALLDASFIMDAGKYRRPLTEKERNTVEEQRDKDLDRAFAQLLEVAQSSGKKLKDVRHEAILHGFTKAYQAKRFADIVTVAKKLDPAILENNSEINDFVEVARMKLGEEL